MTLRSEGQFNTVVYEEEDLYRGTTRRDVVIVAPTEAALEAAEEWIGDAPRVIGDPSDDDVLKEAGIERAAGIVFCMNSDKDNVIGVLTARRLAPRARIIAATEQPESEAKLRTVGADAVVSPTRIGGLRIASELIRPTVVSFLDRMLRAKDSTLRIEEVTVPKEANIEGQTIGSLRADDVAGAVLLAVRHPDTGEYIFKPPPDTPLHHGTTLVVMADADGHELLKGRFKRATGVIPRPELPAE
jgi:voltage-gated potassium channel